MSKLTSHRSRAYPVLSLEESLHAMDEILGHLGSGSFSREVLAGALGYSNAGGGPGARKIAALVQYGFLRRQSGLYSPTRLATRAVRATNPGERRSALRTALHQPPLFKALLERYGPQGRVPLQLESVLWRDHGITRKASPLAAENFRESARSAGILDRGGAFLTDDEPELPQTDLEKTIPKPIGPGTERPSKGAPIAEQRFEFVLTEDKVAKLSLPMALRRKDLEIIRRQIEFLEYQIEERD